MIEFIGCLAALGGGLVIGSIYLGVDVKSMAAVILEKADIQVPAILSNDSLSPDRVNPSGLESERSPGVSIDSTSVARRDNTAENAVENTVENTADELLARRQNEDNAPRPPSQQAGGAADASLLAAPQELSSRKEFTKDEKQVATQSCWEALRQCVQNETTNRTKTINDPERWQLMDYLLHRQAGHQQVVDTIVQLDQHGIDQRLQMHIRQLHAWHRTGADLYERAAQLLTDAPSGKLTGPFAQSWQSAATQHRMEEKLLLDKHAAVASYLERSHKRP